jgi:acylphosphatase
MTGRRYVVRGLVQGVGYRYFTREAAIRLGVRGWVRNLPSGEVEIHAEAGLDTLGEFRSALERGPMMAQVSKVTEEDAPVSGSYSSFIVKG